MITHLLLQFLDRLLQVPSMAAALEVKTHFIHDGCLCGVGNMKRLSSTLVFAKTSSCTRCLTFSNSRINLTLQSTPMEANFRNI